MNGYFKSRPWQSILRVCSLSPVICRTKNEHGTRGGCVCVGGGGVAGGGGLTSYIWHSTDVRAQ